MKNHSFSDQIIFKNEDSPVELTKCLFIECHIHNSSGGAIYMNIPEGNSSLLINCSGFANCSSNENGGAIYCCTRNINILRTCFQNCECDKKDGQILFLTSPLEIVTNYIQIHDESINENEGSYLLYIAAKQKTLFNTYNISGFRFSNCMKISSHITEINFLYLDSVVSDSVIYVSETALLLTNSDFVNSTASNSFIIARSTLILITDSVFTSISSNLVDLDDRSQIQFDSVHLDKNVIISQSNGVSFNDNFTFANQVQLNSDFCWIGQATWDVTNIKFKLSGASISFAIICFLVLCVYIYLKKKLNEPVNFDDLMPKRRKSSDWNEIDDIEENDDILVINEEHQEEEEAQKSDNSKESSGDIPLKNITVDDTNEDKSKKKAKEHTYN